MRRCSYSLLWLVALLCIVAALCLPRPTAGASASSADPPVLSLSYYEVLEVPTDVTASALKKAYRSAALKWHPDRYVERPAELDEANARFVLIAEANDVLSDELKRRDYDLLLEHGEIKYDARKVAEIRNEQNMAWAGKAGFSFSRRRGADGEELDDTWMVATQSMSGACTCISLHGIFSVSVACCSAFHRSCSC